MIEIEDAPQRAVVVHPYEPSRVRQDPRWRLQEAVGLAEALDLVPVHADAISVRSPRAATLFGGGHVATIASLCAEFNAQVVVVDAQLTPVQQRNLEREFKCKVIDRHGLILEIFALRARSKEGVLQVELARLTYERSRLVRTWTHLERQRGGRGFMGGPGETQLESDRRIIDQKIQRLKGQLEEVRRTRKVQRERRRREGPPLFALVGYTNAGKSTLFNRLAKADAFAKDMLFATLDPTVRSLELPSGRKAYLSDTVGFITDLPPDLVAAFRATLEETAEADVILHVRDIADPETEARREDVMGILEDIGAAGKQDSPPLIEVWNKADLLDADIRDAKRMRAAHDPLVVLISATSGQGLDDLLAAMEAIASRGEQVVTIKLPAGEGKALAWLHAHGEVLAHEQGEDGGAACRVRLADAEFGRFQAMFPGLAEQA